MPTAGLLLALSTGIVFAGTTPAACQPIYGGGESCPTTAELEINKTVRDPKSGQYVDDLGVSDAKFAPTSVVTFKITVKNTSDKRLSNITIKDVFPEVVDFSSGIGDYNKNTKVLSIKLEKLDPEEVRDFFIQAKVVGKDKLPEDQNVACVVNQSTITVSNKTAQDNAQFCIDRNLAQTQGQAATTKGGVVTPTPKKPATKVTPTTNPQTTKGGKTVFPPTTAKKTPDTGPEALALIGLIPSALGGIFLRRKTKQ